ncbi:MAG: AhpC/TSA family protein [Odoribacteraceae bacterium]|jgi:thiol-disulfide isomerase/thioredoxin|nr:AhpC/TSA family protein [Odoribacteraceae bacterium]
MKTSTRVAPAVLLAGYLLSLAGCLPGGYVIEGKIDGAEGKAVHLLVGGDEFHQTAVDSAVIANGAFLFKGKLTGAKVFTLKFFPTDERGKMVDNRYLLRPVIPVLVEAGVTRVEAALDSIPLASIYGGYDYSKVRVTGSPLHDLYAEYNEAKLALLAAKDKAKMHYLRRSRSGASTREGIANAERVDAAADDERARVKQFIARNAGNAAGLLVFLENTGHQRISPCIFTAGEIDDILASFSAAMKGTTLYKEVESVANALKETVAGAKFADFTFFDTGGNPVKLSDHVGGRYLLLEFWASWCGPCRADIPHLKMAYNLYHPAGFDVISISMDTDEDKWLKAVEDEQMPWLQLHDPAAFDGDLAKTYDILGIPACVLVDPDGVIVDRNARGSWLDRRLIALYGDKFEEEH